MVLKNMTWADNKCNNITSEITKQIKIAITEFNDQKILLYIYKLIIYTIQ